MRTRILLSIFLVLIAAPALAQSVLVTDHARTRLLAETDGVAPGGDLSLAFAQELEEGWHVYWKNPGDSGLPLEFRWTLPDGASAGDIDYPAPKNIAIGPLVNFGHEGAPVFLTRISVPESAPVGDRIEIGLEATWLICADICVPETGVFSLSVPVVAAPEKNAEAAQLFASARAAVPAPLDGEAFFSVNGETLTLELPALGGDAYFFPEKEGAIEPAAPQKASRMDGRRRLDIAGGPSLASLGDALEGVVSFERDGERKAYALTATRRDAAGGTIASGAAAISLPALFAAAFLGGALLNLMPCVFPILFVKAASMAKSASGDRGAMRRHGVLYAAGVVATFAALAGLLIALRAGGEAVGWGFHLQSPAVIAVSAYILFAVGLNFAGAFHVGSSLQNVGGGLVAGKDGDAGAFLTGALAVFVAAPCVGPFLTAPIGAAAVLPAGSALAIFIAMALGLAAPYVALSFTPAFARALPKPGPWMVRFRQLLAFPVFAAAAYFLWVLSAQTGPQGLALALAGLLVVALAARVFEWGREARWGKGAALALILLSIVPVVLLQPAPAAAAQGSIPFDPADIERRRAAGEPVFIDFTAAWCVTCQVNKLTVFSSPRVKTAFSEEGVAFVTADWTNRNAEIAGALAGFGANGVPLYVYYPPGGEAMILPQPLTERSVLAAVSMKKEGA